MRALAARHGLVGSVVGLLIASASVPPARAATLSVSVADANGAPVGDAVTAAHPVSGSARPERAAGATHVVDQKDETFIPYVEVMRPGDKIVFRNSDITRHHVYSFSPVRAFEYMLAPGESSQALPIGHTGTVAIGCNIHDHMIAYLYVTDAPYTARTGHGQATLTLPAGEWSVHVWHPQQRREAPAQALTLAGADTRALTFTLKLLPDPRRAADPERSGY